MIFLADWDSSLVIFLQLPVPCPEIILLTLLAVAQYAEQAVVYC